MFKKIILIYSLFLISSFISLSAQTANPQTLFPYPQVPDTIKTFENRSNYYVNHFWDNCNLSKPIKDKAAFEGAFEDYVTFFQYAHKTIVRTSVNNLMNKAQANKANFLIIADLAEKKLYQPDGLMWSDEAYMYFASNILKNHEIKGAEREKFEKQVMKINKNQIGAQAQPFDFIDLNGDKKNLNDYKADNILIFFNTPDCKDCDISRLRLSTNVIINQLIKDGKLIILSIYPGKYSKEWAETAKKYSDNWIVGAYDGAEDNYDLRIIPNVYLLDSNKLILRKNDNINLIINNLNK